MDGLSNLDSFIAGCDATKMGAFLELIQRRFSEAQAQKQKRLEGFILLRQKQLRDTIEIEKKQLNENIRNSVVSLRRKRDAAAVELSEHLEAARAKKQHLLHSFHEYESSCQEIEVEMKELTKRFVAKQQEMEKKQKQTLKIFFQDALQKLNDEREAAVVSLQEIEEEQRKAAKALKEILTAFAPNNVISLLHAS